MMTSSPGLRLFRRLFWLLVWVVVAGGVAGWWFWSGWNRLAKLEPRGGLYFPWTVELAVPSFRQNDERWGRDPLGPSTGTLGSEGCAVSSAAMVLKFYGMDTDPQRLNQFLSSHAGYTPQGWVYWEAAAEFTPGKVRHAYEDLPSYRLIDLNLLRRNPVIVRVRMPSGGTHFVVIAGKRGLDYLIRDPGAGASRGIYPLRDLQSPVEALRYYDRLPGS
jgi:hypothetical protein